MTDLNTYTFTRKIHGEIETFNVKAATRREATIMANDYAYEANKGGKR